MSQVSTQQAKRILLADDDEMFRLALRGTLERAGFSVTVADGGKSAQNLLNLETFDALVADIRMPDLNGIQLLHFAKKVRPLPVILMTGFAELSATQEAYDLGADEFISKPFSSEEIIGLVMGCLSVDFKEIEDRFLDSDYCKLSLDDFISGKTILFDVYVRLSGRKYIKIAKKGDDIPADRIAQYKQKAIKFLYMRKEDFRNYIDFNVKLAKTVRGSSSINKARKLKFLKHTGEVILEHLYCSEIEEESFEAAKTIVENTVSVVCDSPDCFDLITLLNDHSDFLYAHSLGVALYSVLIAKKLQWVSPPTVFKVTLGGLLHDIGKKEIERDLLDKPRQALSPAEVKQIESHATRGMEILANIPGLPGDIAQIAIQHHEDCIGQGYPLGLKQSRLHPLARIVALANSFCNLAIKSSQGPGLPPKEAIQRLLSLNAHAYDPQAAQGLLKVFGMISAEFQAKGTKAWSIA